MQILSRPQTSSYQYMDKFGLFNNLVLINLKCNKNLHVCEFMMKYLVYPKYLWNEKYLLIIE